MDLDHIERCATPESEKSRSHLKLQLFRDYSVGDMAMVRFGPGSKISERFYKRQDGTRSYFFTKGEVASLAEGAGLSLYQNAAVARRTVNKKEGVDVARVFLQAKMFKSVE